VTEIPRRNCRSGRSRPHTPPHREVCFCTCLSCAFYRGALFLGRGLVDQGRTQGKTKRATTRPGKGMTARTRGGEGVGEEIEPGIVHGRSLRDRLRTAVEARHQEGAKSPSSIVLPDRSLHVIHAHVNGMVRWSCFTGAS
jgi:hypothetical protein